MKYIDADKLIAEIRKLRSESCISESDDYYEYAKSEIIDIITSLQQEQPKQDITEFEKALNDFGEAYSTLVDRDNNPNQGIRVSAYHELIQESINKILSLAKENVKQEQPDGLDEAAENYAHSLGYDEEKDKAEIAGAKEDFIAGAEWQKRQIMKDAVEVVVVDDWQYGKDTDGAKPAIKVRNPDWKIGDKKKVIILK